MNGAIRPLRDQLNAKVTRHLGASRCSLFEDQDKPALRPLPRAPYVYAEWKQRRAGIDYHIDVDRHYYAVPHQLIKRKLWVRITPARWKSSIIKVRGLRRTFAPLATVSIPPC